MEVLLLITLLIAVSAELNVEEASSNDIGGALKKLLKRVNEQGKIIDSLQSEITSCKKNVGSLTKDFELIKKEVATCCEKKETPTGKTQTSPVKSCKWLQENYDNLGSGLYWISLKEPTQVYCDMRKKYDGGGWMMVGSAEFKSDSEAKDYDFDRTLSNSISNLRQTQTKRFLLSSQGLRELQGYINFTQIRFYCHKAWHGRSIHIKTSQNSLGRSVVDLMTEKSEYEPKACGSYERLSNDNSFISASCDEWWDKKWYNYGEKNVKMYASPMWMHSTRDGSSRGFSLVTGDLNCDDNSPDHSLTNVGEWAFYVR